MENEILDGHTYKHYKGGLYSVIGIAYHSETLRKLVVYKNSEGKMWVRPLEMFLDNVLINGVTMKRFAPVIPDSEEGA